MSEIKKKRPGIIVRSRFFADEYAIDAMPANIRFDTPRSWPNHPRLLEQRAVAPPKGKAKVQRCIDPATGGGDPGSSGRCALGPGPDGSSRTTR